MGIRRSEVTFCSGTLSLEGVLSIPKGMATFPAVIICHPHPLNGGSMENNVVDSVFNWLAQESFISLKFNFRGVGKSEGMFSNGTGEQQDVAAAISFLTTVREVDPKNIGLAGYSAGAAFAMPVFTMDSRVKALAVVSPPLLMFDFDPLKKCMKPELLITGDKDDLTPVGHFREFCQTLPANAECATIKGADHFWRGYEASLAERVTAFFTKFLKSETLG